MKRSIYRDSFSLQVFIAGAKCCNKHTIYNTSIFSFVYFNCISKSDCAFLKSSRHNASSQRTLPHAIIFWTYSRFFIDIDILTSIEVFCQNPSVPVLTLVRIRRAVFVVKCRYTHVLDAPSHVDFLGHHFVPIWNEAIWDMVLELRACSLGMVQSQRSCTRRKRASDRSRGSSVCFLVVSRTGRQPQYCYGCHFMDFLKIQFSLKWREPPSQQLRNRLIKRSDLTFTNRYKVVMLSSQAIKIETGFCCWAFFFLIYWWSRAMPGLLQ